MLTLKDAGSVLDMSPESIRRRILAGAIKGKYDRGSPKFGWVIEREEYVRYLRSIGEHRRADDLERGAMPN